MSSTILERCRMIKITSDEFRTLIDEGWPYDDLGSAEVTFDPALAFDCYVVRHPNRTISPSDQAKLQLALGADRWQTNGQAIVFSQEMRLLNGQNRLHACAESQHPLTSVTVWGVSTSVVPTMDIGKKHSGADILAALDKPDASAMAAALRTYYQLDQGALLSGSKVLPDYEILGYYDVHQPMYYSLGYGLKTQTLLPPSLGSALHYAFRHKHADLADTFVQQLGDGQNLTSRDPIYVLREFLLQQRAKDRRIRRGREQKEYGLAAHRVILAWKAVREERTLSFEALKKTDIKQIAEIV